MRIRIEGLGLSCATTCRGSLLPASMNKPSNAVAIAVIRVVASLLLPPIAAGVVMFLTYMGLWYVGIYVFEGPPPSDGLGARHIAMGLAFYVTLVAVAMTGAAVPAVLWIGSRGRLTLRNLLLLGAVLGNVPFALIVVSILVVQLMKSTLSPDVARLWYGFYGTVRAVALGLLLGISSAAVFWVIGIRGGEAESVRTVCPWWRRQAGN